MAPSSCCFATKRAPSANWYPSATTKARHGANHKRPTSLMLAPNNVQVTCLMAPPIWSVALQTANSAGLWFCSLAKTASDSTKPSCSVAASLTIYLPDATKADTKPWATAIPNPSYTKEISISDTPQTKKM